jgi:hypothetical protein
MDGFLLTASQVSLEVFTKIWIFILNLRKGRQLCSRDTHTFPCNFLEVGLGQPSGGDCPYHAFAWGGSSAYH